MAATANKKTEQRDDAKAIYCDCVNGRADWKDAQCSLLQPQGESKANYEGRGYETERVEPSPGIVPMYSYEKYEYVELWNFVTIKYNSMIFR